MLTFSTYTRRIMRATWGLVLLLGALWPSGAAAGEPTYPVGCPGLDPVDLAVNPYAGSTVPDEFPTEPIQIAPGEAFGVVVEIGDLGGNELVFLSVTLDDNTINGNTGTAFGFSIVTEPGSYVFGSVAPDTFEGIYYAVATLISAESVSMGCNNLSQAYNTDVAIFITETCIGDANSDGEIDPLDAGFVLARFGCDLSGSDPSCDDADVNNDGMVDPLDVGFVLSRLNSCVP